MSNNNLPQKSNNTEMSSSEFENIKKLIFDDISKNRITRNNPCPIIFLIDQSGSMDETYVNYRNENTTLAKEVAEQVNHFFEYLLYRATNGNEILEYYTFLLIGYGNEDEDNYASIVWEGKLAGKEWVTVKELADNILDVSTKTETKYHHWGEQYIEKTTKKIWIYPNANGRNTPLLSALKLCKDKLAEYMQNKYENFPPVVFNITDGIPTDVDDMNDLITVCNEIKNIDTTFGKTILFNCLLSSSNENKTFLPRQSERHLIESNDNYNDFYNALFDASSILPSYNLAEAYLMYKDEKYNEKEPIKSLVLNVDPSKLLQLFKIGTRTTK